MSAVIERRDLAALATEIAEHLRAVRERLAEEIRTYPTPIPRCDAQFNHLYEQLGRLSRDLDDIEATRESIERFIASAPYSDDPAERDFRTSVKAALR
ncbi:MAG TPA: hypothetical protein VFK92_07515 [Burkholderiales bacterium]|nr:hypothetical protein [Burkholderiales bacterium]